MSIIRKTGNVLLIVLGVFLILTGILSAKIRNPRFQTYLSEQFIGYLSKKLKAELSIGSVNFELFHHLILHDVLIKDQTKDTLLLAKTIDISFGLLDLFQKKYVVKQVTLDQSRVYLHKFKETGDFNFQFIADAFSSDSTSASSTASSPAELDLNALVINQIHFVMLDEPNDTRLDFVIPKIAIDVKKLDLDKSLIRLNEISFHNADLKVAKLVREIEPDDTLGLPDTAVVHINTKPLRLYVSKLRFVDSQFQFDDELEQATTEGFDPFHQLYKNLNIEFTGGSMVMDTIVAKIQNISFTEKCGFVVKHMEADAWVTPSASVANHLKIETANSRISNYFSMIYVNFHGFLNYNSSVAMKAVLNQSSVSLTDISYFMPQLKSSGEHVLTNGTLSGTVDNLKGKDLKLGGGSVSRFNGDIDIKGLPETDETYIDFTIHQLTTNAGDVARFIPGIKLPAEFLRLGTVNFNGSFSGFFSDFVAYGVMNSQLGQVRSDINMKFKNDYRDATYSGNLAMQQFNIGSYSGLDSLLGQITFDAKISGSGLKTDDVDASMTGNIRQFQFNGYNYQNINVDGSFTKKLFTGKLNMSDENLQLAFTGMVDYNDTLPVYDFKASVRNAHLNTLHFTDKPNTLSTDVDMNMRGDNIDNLIGYAKATNTVFTKPQNQYSLDTVILNINEAGGAKHFLLASSFGRATFDGTFELTKLPQSFLATLDHYFPSLQREPYTVSVKQDFDFDVNLKDVSGILSFFFPRLKGISYSSFHGHFNSLNNDISFAGIIPSAGYTNIMVDTLNVNTATEGGRLNFSASSTSMTFGDSGKIIKPSFKADVANDSARLHLYGSNLPQNTYVSLDGVLSGDTAGLVFHVLPSELVLNSARWDISEENLISYGDSRLKFTNFTLSHKDESISISNVNLRPRATNLHFDFNKLPIADLYHFVRSESFDLTGELSGSMEVLNVFNAPRLQANTILSNLTINKRSISQAIVNMSYVPEDDQVLAQLLVTDASYDIRGNGSFFPRKENNQLNFDFDFRSFDLSFFETMLPGYFDHTEGSANGNLHLSGNRDAPLLIGEVKIPFLTTKVDYLQTTYHTYNEVVTFNADNIDIGKMKLMDENNDIAEASGVIHHHHLDDFDFNLTVNAPKIQALKTTYKDNNLFYGTAEAAGIIQFLGPPEAMEIRANVTSKQGTQISIPINSGTSVADRSFIRYVKRGSDSLSYSYTSSEMINGLRLDLDLEITPDAEIKIIFDQKAGDIIKGNGNGNLRLEIDTKGEFNMYGTFTIEQGDYLFTLQNFFNKFFTIDRGGTISWTGDPYEARIDIDAIYSTKASVYDLVAGSTTSDEELKDLQRRIPVEVALKLTGSLLLPDVTFDIRLPDETTLSSVAYQEVEKVKQDEGELNKQVFGLLILNRFLPTNSGAGNQNIGSDVNNSVSEFLLNQLSYWTSQIRPDIDFNFNYQSYEANLNSSNPNDLTKRNELEIALTKRFFKDRLALEAGGNFDFATANSDPSGGSSSGGGSTNVAGDFSVDYKITPDGRLSSKAFSKSQYDVVDERYKTKNGIALSYKREFNKLRELFQKDPEREKLKAEQKRLKEEEKRLRHEQKMRELNPETSPSTSN